VEAGAANNKRWLAPVVRAVFRGSQYGRMLVFGREDVAK
jgi:hypothetical protein